MQPGAEGDRRPSTRPVGAQAPQGLGRTACARIDAATWMLTCPAQPQAQLPKGGLAPVGLNRVCRSGVLRSSAAADTANLQVGLCSDQIADLMRSRLLRGMDRPLSAQGEVTRKLGRPALKLHRSFAADLFAGRLLVPETDVRPA
jgi:hypothetical protein